VLIGDILSPGWYLFGSRQAEAGGQWGWLPQRQTFFRSGRFRSRLPEESDDERPGAQCPRASSGSDRSPEGESAADVQ
jgi:hypothetical protein